VLFPTFTFAVFFVVVLTASWLLHRFALAWKLLLLAASYLFYLSFYDSDGWAYLLLIIASSLANQGFALLLGRARASGASPETRKLLVVTAVAANLGLLAYFKYATWFMATIDRPIDQILLPWAISFFTFQGISYVVDVHRGTVEPARTLDFCLYLGFFPHVVSGPIVRASEFIPQLQRRPDPRNIDLSRAAFLIGLGLFKKVVVASYLGDRLVGDVFADPGRHSSLEVLVGVYGYAIQLYADFSGYTDMAIGLALLLGLQFPQNFDRPYSAVSLQEFWRRWHMTLSRWLRDYLYIGLGGNRKGPGRRDLNMFATMVLGGLWHGANMGFVVWGALHGLWLGLERRFYERRGQTGPKNPWLGRLVTFHVVCVGWVFFNAAILFREETTDTWGAVGRAFAILGRLFTAWGEPSPFIGWVLVVVIAVALIAQVMPRTGPANVMADVARLPPWAIGVGFGLWLVIVDELGPSGVPDWIYGQF
jgi:alginate O-acetyltransferase complex protein AlgI